MLGPMAFVLIRLEQGQWLVGLAEWGGCPYHKWPPRQVRNRPTSLSSGPPEEGTLRPDAQVWPESL